MTKKKKKPLTVDKKIEKLIETYTKAEKNLIDIIVKKKIKGNSTRFYTEMLKQVQAEILKLKVYNTQWSTDITKALYLQAFEEQLKLLQIEGYTFTALHKEAVELITNNMINSLNNAIDVVGRRTEDAIRDIGLSSTVDKFATGYTIKQQQKQLKEELLDKNITCIKDKLGRNINVVFYASMVARSVVAETQNTCIKNLAKEYGHDLVKMTHHATSCHICQPYEGKIYSISGKDEKYPPLSSVPGFGAGYNNIHPNCKHRIFVYVSKYNEDTEKDNKENDVNYKELLESKNIKLDSSLDKIDKKLLEENLIELNRLIDKYPVVKEYAKNNPFTFKAENIKGNTLALCNTSFDGDKINIVLNIDRYSNYKDLVDNAIKNRNSKWHVDGVIEKSSTQTLSHEFGHAIHNILINKYNKDNPEIRKEALIRINKQRTPSTKSKEVTKYRAGIIKRFNKEILEYAKKINPKLKIRESVSEYGKSSPPEFFAECFANLENGKSNEYGEAMREFLERNFK